MLCSSSSSQRKNYRFLGTQAHDQQFQVLFNYSCPNLGGEGSTHPIEAMTNLSEEGGAGELHCAEHSEEKVCFLSETSTTPACDAFLKETEESLKYVLEEIGELRQRISPRGSVWRWYDPALSQGACLRHTQYQHRFYEAKYVGTVQNVLCGYADQT